MQMDGKRRHLVSSPSSDPMRYSLYQILFFALLLTLTGTATGQLLPPLSVTISLASPSVAVGSSVIVNCFTTAQQVTYWWFNVATGQTVFNGSVLTIQFLSPSSAGPYRCAAQNSVGTSLSTVFAPLLSYVSSTSAQLSVINVAANFYTIVPLNGVVYGGQLGPVVWTENGVTLPQSGSSTRYITLSGSLVVLGTIGQSSLTYVANVTDSFNINTVQSTTVNVQVSSNTASGSTLIPVLAPSNVTAVATFNTAPVPASVSFECVWFAGSSSVVNVNWYVRAQGSSLSSSTPVLNGAQSSSRFLMYTVNNFGRRLTLTGFFYVPETAVYGCNASSSLATANAEASLLVATPLGVVASGTQPVNFGTDVTILCASSVPFPAGTTPVTITWYRNASRIATFNSVSGSVVLAGSKYVVNANASLTISTVDLTDSTVYECVAQNAAGETAAATYVQVAAAAPTLLNGPSNTTMSSNNASFTLQCTFSGIPTPITFWRVANNITTSNITNGGRYTVTVANAQGSVITTLQVASPVLTDSGLYACLANNGVGAASGQAYATVTQPTTIVVPPQNQTAVKGSIVQFACGYVAMTQAAVTVNWFVLVNAQFANVNTSTYSYMSVNQLTGTLTITSVRSTDTTTYMCVVSSNSGSDSRAASLVVLELPYAPTVTYVTPVSSNVASSVMASVGWQAGFNGNSPLTSFSIYARNGLSISLATLQPFTLLVSSIPPTATNWSVTSLGAGLTYQFSMTATNQIGQSALGTPSQFVVMPESPPTSPPQAFQAYALSSTTIQLTWSAPVTSGLNGVLQGYVVSYVLNGYASTFTKYVVLSESNIQSYPITSLIPYTFYDCAVSAYNGAGNGTFTSIVTVRTLEDVPTFAPQLTSAQVLNSTSLQAVFLPPSEGSINGVLQGYTVYCTPTLGSELKFFIAATSTSLSGPQTTVVNGLTPYTNYSVTVTCSTRVGQSGRSNALLALTMQSVPGPLGSLSTTIVLDTSVTLTWTPPATPNGLLTAYTLVYNAANSNQNFTVSISASSTTYTQTGLQPLTTYSFALAANTAVGVGPFSVAQVQTSVTPGPPSAPTNLAVTNVLATQVTVQFVPGSASASQTVTLWLVQAYNVSCGQPTVTNCWPLLYSTYSPSTSSFVLPSLTPYTSYTIRLLAQNSVATSSASNAVSFQTLYAPPSAAPTFVSITLNSTAISVFWQSIGSTQWNGPPLGYVVQYTMLALNGSALQTSPSVISVPSSSTYSIVLSSLVPFMYYQLQIAASNIFTAGPLSNASIGFTFDAPPSAAPTSLQLVATTSYNITVSWGSVPFMQQNGLINGFAVCYFCTLPVGCSVACLYVTGSAASSATLTGLFAFTTYSVDVKAYNRMGFGPSSASIVATTNAGVPGPVSSAWLASMTSTSIVANWATPNVIGSLSSALLYTIACTAVSLSQSNSVQQQLLVVAYPTSSVLLSNLTANVPYSVVITTSNPSGTGSSYSLVYTSPTGQPPAAPTFVLSNGVPVTIITTNSVTLQVTSTSSTMSIRNYTVQYWPVGLTTVNTVYIDASQGSTQLTVTNLLAYTSYQFQVAATNDFGTSFFSQATPANAITTLCDVPARAPSGFTAVPQTANSLLVSWTPLDSTDWRCAPASYVVQYNGLGLTNVLLNLQQPYANQTSSSFMFTSVTLSNLGMQYYTLRIAAANSLGTGPFNTPIIVLAGQTVPSVAPTQVGALAQSVTSTSVTISWTPLPASAGQIMGYKVYYTGSNLATGQLQPTLPQPAVGRRKRQASSAWPVSPANSGSLLVAPTQSSAIVPNLTPYSQYSLSVAALSAAGEGPNSSVTQVQTSQDLPGSPGVPAFYYVTYYSALVSWAPPYSPNGLITGYVLLWLTNTGMFSQPLNSTALSFTVSGLLSSTQYTFSVRAQTQVGLGTTSNLSQLTTGPQLGAPGPVQALTLTQTSTAFSLNWQSPLFGAVLGFYIEWTLATSSGTPLATASWSNYWLTNNKTLTYSIPLSVLLPASNYLVRVSAYNLASVSPYTYPNGMPTGGYTTPSGSTPQPFYTQWWFLVIVALIGVIAVVSVILLLVLTNRKQQHKRADDAQAPARGTLPADLGERNLAFDNAPMQYQAGSQSTAPYLASQMRSSQSQLNAIPPPLAPGYGYAQTRLSFGSSPRGVPNEMLSGTVAYAAPINTLRRGHLRRTSESHNGASNGIQRFDSDERILADADARSATASNRGSMRSLARRRSRSEDRQAAARAAANAPQSSRPVPGRPPSQPPTRQSSTSKPRDDMKRSLSDSFSDDSSFDDDEDSKQPIPPSDSEKVSVVGSLNDIVSPSRSNPRAAAYAPTDINSRNPARPSASAAPSVASRYPVTSDTESDVYGSAQRAPNSYLYAPFTVVRRSTGPGSRGRPPPAASAQNAQQPSTSNAAPALPPKPNASRSANQPAATPTGLRGPPPAYSNPPQFGLPSANANARPTGAQPPARMLNANVPVNIPPSTMQRSPQSNMNNLMNNLDAPFQREPAAPTSPMHLRGTGQALQDFSTPAFWPRGPPNPHNPTAPAGPRINVRMNNPGSSIV